ncbi:hypothetical protein [Aquisphaera insulae]|uniref:hypothetical protein n=1 Tax=Aquisphaera insulae TaxID=2712864 RepID=UPI0013EA1046|nr:hypothetical protein [Aquisphaera insulae]
MDRTEEILVDLFSRLRGELKADSGIGLALKAAGPDLTLRIRTSKPTGDEKRPYYAIVVGTAERDGSFRVSYKPGGVPLAERQVTIIEDHHPVEELLGLIRRHVEAERRRVIEFRDGP